LGTNHLETLPVDAEGIRMSMFHSTALLRWSTLAAGDVELPHRAVDHAQREEDEDVVASSSVKTKR
jgi:hypothetical protein